MTWILQRYRLMLIILTLAVFAAVVWFMISRQNAEKIPSRGVFVMEAADRNIEFNLV